MQISFNNCFTNVKKAGRALKIHLELITTLRHCKIQNYIPLFPILTTSK